MHSHAAAQKSSGAFFGVMGRERCRKRPSARRNALRASVMVRARDVMVNLFFETICSDDTLDKKNDDRHS